MKLIRHILSHLILITILFGLVSVFYYRYSILPDNYVQGIDFYAEKIHPGLKSFARAQILYDKTKPASSSQQGDRSPVVAAIETAESESTEMPVAEFPEKHSQTEITKDVAEEKQPSIEEQVVADIAAADVPVYEEIKPEEEKAQSLETDDVTENPPVKEDAESIVAVDDNTQPVASQNESAEDGIVTDKEAASANGMLRAARLAFQQGKLDVAIKKYSDLVELENDEADFYGELGNVYYAMGQWDKAGIAYYEAAIRLIEERHLYQVAYLHRVIQGLDLERADKLAEKLAVLRQ